MIMTDYDILITNLIEEIKKLHHKYENSLSVGPDYYEPGFMEYPEQYYGSYDESTGIITIKFEAMGTRYEGRTEQIESVKLHDKIKIVRDTDNSYNRNNFILFSESDKNLGTLPADLCNALAPLYDNGKLLFKSTSVSFVKPISVRSRHAKKAVLFIEVVIELKR